VSGEDNLLLAIRAVAEIGPLEEYDFAAVGWSLYERHRENTEHLLRHASHAAEDLGVALDRISEALDLDDRIPEEDEDEFERIRWRPESVFGVEPDEDDEG
jgi:hypothetical protein